MPPLKGPYLGQNLTDNKAEIFAPGFISTPDADEYGCTFSADGKEFYFTKTLQNPKRNIIYSSKQTITGWTKPEPVAFIKEQQVGEPIISPDGNLFLFGKIVKNKNLNTITSEIWYSKKDKESWETPQFLFSGMYASISKENNIYFTDVSKGFEKAKIAKTKFDKDNENMIEQLSSPVNSPYQDAHPYIDPEGKYLLFDSDRPGGYGKSDIYISYKINEQWSEPVNLGPAVNTEHYDAIPYISPDGKYLFFCRVMGQGDIYWIDTKVIVQRTPSEKN
ncbi:MAG: PD40 domain-containing protein [Calditrichia bacterium]|nr:PD40 domain-containing protein [Calditrichia bacterium]